MTKGLVRYQQAGCFHFVTFSCYRRLPYPGTESARCGVGTSCRSICVTGKRGVEVRGLPGLKFETWGTRQDNAHWGIPPHAIERKLR
jgi:hypothetical protein